MKFNIKFIEMIILFMEIILLFSFSIIIFSKFDYSFNFYVISAVTSLIMLWRMYNYGRK